MIEITLPAMGEGIIEAVITRWLVGEGEKVTTDQPLVEVATDKVDSEIPSPGEGNVHKIVLREGDTAKVGQVMALIAVDGEIRQKEEADTGKATDQGGSPTGVKDQETLQAEATRRIILKPGVEPLPLDPDQNYMKATFLSPIIRKLAMDHGLYPSEIQNIKGSGLGGRITRSDVLSYLAENRKNPPPAGEAFPGEEVTRENEVIPGREKTGKPKPLISEEQIYGGGPSTVEEMDRMRKRIADHMVYSKDVAPHVSSFVECDVTEMMIWREGIRDEFQKRYGQKLTLTTLIIEASILALKEYPGINVSVDGQKIIRKHQINLGLATALPNGNLIVPVIREADTLSLQGLAARVNDLADRARKAELQPEEVQGGTFTVTNMGQFGNIAGTPIINQPQSAILAIGAIIKKPAVVRTPEGDAIGIRNILILTLSYDHRVVDGALGGSYLRAVGDKLQKWDIHRTL